MLAALLNVPRDKAEWDRWSEHHRHDHDDIRAAIQARGGPNFNQYQLDPVPFNQILDWLARNQLTHTDMHGYLHLQGADLERVDFADPKQSQAWHYAHYLEHYAARAELEI
jgi:hypothetical protein